MGQRRSWPVWLAAVSLGLGVVAAWRYARGPDASSSTRAIAKPQAEGARDSRKAELGPLDARRVAIGALFKEPSLALKLQRVLQAVEEDPTPPERDPLWSYLVENLAALWTPATFARGRDLMLMEDRPRARRALVASFARLSQPGRIESLSGDQRRQLSGDLIDTYAAADPSQKPEIAGAIRNLAGDDVVEILSGRGLEPGAVLKAEVEHERLVQDGLNELRQGNGELPAPPDEPTAGR